MNVGHERECKMPGREMKFVFWLALTLALSPGERGQLLCVSGLANTGLANPVARISVRRRTTLLLCGRRPGGRAFNPASVDNPFSLFPDQLPLSDLMHASIRKYYVVVNRTSRIDDAWISISDAGRENPVSH